ncbi:MAG: ATP-binding cassette domain-containing protein [Brachymonas sp.]|nr:ATP-binding cassette domain-containing protein [Brachymonas sp.]MBP6965879.1 ATP-binding cassette domain-containing protein [Brachymonas sp.]MBP7743778.1 ATP-binding cassette domain-containing protein [Brachymonas sp.]MBP8746910.1 ATP-binding cassette domain-containing protein [Brachymonas sp.]MBP9589778.1 ATP-binding cassette domain-containing protein [Brachymonas sp.]
MLEVRDITFRWQNNGAGVLNGASFNLAEGETVGIMGPSGCGKSTLARILTGHFPLQNGSILLDGKPLPTQGVHPLQLVMQHAELALNPRWRVGQSLREGWQPDDETIARFGIRPEWLERYPHELSGGENQRIAIVRALIPGIRVLVADELTTMHDPITQVQIWRNLQATLRERKVAMIAISHDEALLKALNARVLRLHAGKFAAGAADCTTTASCCPSSADKHPHQATGGSAH